MIQSPNISSLAISWLGFNKCGRDTKEWSAMIRTSGRSPTTNKTTCQWTTTGLIKKWWCGDEGVFSISAGVCGGRNESENEAYTPPPLKTTLSLTPLKDGVVTFDL